MPRWNYGIDIRMLLAGTDGDRALIGMRYRIQRIGFLTNRSFDMDRRRTGSSGEHAKILYTMTESMNLLM